MRYVELTQLLAHFQFATMSPVAASENHVKSVGLRAAEELEGPFFFEMYASAYILWIVVGRGTKLRKHCLTRGGFCTWDASAAIEPSL